MGDRMKKAGACLTMAIALCGCETVIETPFAEPVDFDAPHYCEVDSGAELTLPDAITAAIEGKTVDEEALANAILV